MNVMHSIVKRIKKSQQYKKFCGYWQKFWQTWLLAIFSYHIVQGGCYFSRIEPLVVLNERMEAVTKHLKIYQESHEDQSQYFLTIDKQLIELTKQQERIMQNLQRHGYGFIDRMPKYESFLNPPKNEKKGK